MLTKLEDIHTFLDLFPECNRDDIDCNQFIYPIWKQYRKMISTNRKPRRHKMEIMDSKMAYIDNPISSIENSIIVNPMLFELENAIYVRIKHFPKRNGNNCGGGIYSQLSKIDSFPDFLVMKRCVRQSEVRKTLIVQNSSFTPHIWAISSPYYCEECGDMYGGKGERVDIFMEHCGIPVRKMIYRHIQNRTRFITILERFLFEIMDHIHNTYNTWHCDSEYHNIFINERHELKIIDWEKAQTLDVHDKYPACVDSQATIHSIETRMIKDGPSVFSL